MNTILNDLKKELIKEVADGRYYGCYKGFEFIVTKKGKIWYYCNEIPVAMKRSLSGLLLTIKTYIDEKTRTGRA